MKLAVRAYDADTGVKVIDVAADAVVAKDADVGVKVMEVAVEAVVANELEILLNAQLDVPNKLPVIPPVKNLKDPVISASPITCNSVGKLLDSTSDPVIRWLPTNVLDPVVANTEEAVLFSSCAFCENDDVVGVKVILVAADAVVANDAVDGVKVMEVAADAVVAKLLDPSKDAVIPPVTPKLPVTVNEPDVVNDPLNITISVVVINDPVII
jgi:hypothetical protein